MEDTSRARILQMLKDGVITVEEAEELLRALEGGQATEPAVALKDNRGRKGRKLRVQVDAAEAEGRGKAKVNVNVPISLIKTLGPIVARNLPLEAKAELDKAGVDLLAIMEEIDTLIQSGLEEDIVNVDVGEGAEMAKVRIYVE